MIGRSNLQQAVPITFGYKMAGLLSAIERHRQRLAEIRPRILVGEFAGASGTLASIEVGGLATQAGLMQELGLGPARHRLAYDTRQHRGSRLLPGSGHRHAGQVLDRCETDDADRSGRSVRAVRTRPRLEQHHAAKTQPDLVLLHPRLHQRGPPACRSTAGCECRRSRTSTGPWEIEWIVLPETFCLTAGALAQSRFVLEGLEVDEKRMRANLDMTNGLVVSEAVMMGLGPNWDANMRMTWCMTSAAPRSRRIGRCSICWSKTPKFPNTWTAPH